MSVEQPMVDFITDHIDALKDDYLEVTGSELDPYDPDEIENFIANYEPWYLLAVEAGVME